MFYDLDTYKKKFIKAALNSGYSNDNIDKCLNYAEILINNQLPVIYNLTHLSALVGYKKGYIIQAAVVSKYSEAYYKYYKVRKKNGGERNILEPLPNLKDIQYWILRNILENISVSSFAKAYKKNLGLKDNLKFHKGQRKVLALDIKDFFPSIKRETIESIFLNLGYSVILSEYLSKLCCLNESLPQGAPTSPYISNIIMKEIDDVIGKYCIENNIRFTRYSDDMTFSGDFEVTALITFVKDVLGDAGFELNAEKQKLMLANERQFVTGVVVNEKVQLSKDDRRKIRQSMYFIQKFGFDNHVEHLGITKSNYINHLIGKIGFGIYLNPKDKDLMKYMQVLQKIKKEKQI